MAIKDINEIGFANLTVGMKVLIDGRVHVIESLESKDKDDPTLVEWLEEMPARGNG